MRPTKEESSLLSPEFDDRWTSYFANASDKPVMEVLQVAIVRWVQVQLNSS